MTRVRTLPALLAWITAAGVLVLAGCSTDSGSPISPGAEQTQTTNLTEPTGGLTSVDEEPAFGSADIQAEVEAEKEVDDPLGDDPVVRNLSSNPHPVVYAVTILWGQLQADREVAQAGGTLYDWSGSLTAEHGAVLLRSVVSFEDNDEILPRTRRESLEWVSHTEGGFDGLRVLYYPPRADSGLVQETLTLTTPLYSRTFTLGELELINEIVPVDENGNQVSIQSFLVPPTTNTIGFVRGRWTAMAPGDTLGFFAGVWLGDHGWVSGTVRGHYGENAAGDHVFFGKVIDAAGHFRGFLRGSWESAEDPTNAGAQVGRFWGAWVDDQGHALGAVHGRFRAAEDRPGFFDGRWCRGCPVEP